MVFITLVFRMYDIVSGKSLRKAIAYVTKIGVTQLIDDNDGTSRMKFESPTAT